MATFTLRVSNILSVLLVTRFARTAIRSTAPFGTLVIENVGVDWFAALDRAEPIETSATSVAAPNPLIVPLSVLVPGTGLSVHSAAAAAVTSDRP